MDAMDSSENESDSEHRSKKRKLDENRVRELIDDIASIKETLTEMMRSTAESKLPMGLKRMLQDTFKCHICYSVPAKPPLIITKYCRNMLGCKGCVNQWYSGPKAMTKTCPMCRAERLQQDNAVAGSYKGIGKLYTNEEIAAADSNHQVEDGENGH